MLIRFYQKPGINDRVYPELEKDGYVVERFFGQTMIYLPSKSEFKSIQFSIFQLTQRCFINYDLSTSEMSIHPDGISLCLPSVLDSRRYIQTRDLADDLNEDPSKIHPDYFLPDLLVRKIYLTANVK